MGSLQHDFEKLLKQVVEPRALLRIAVEVALDQKGLTLTPAIQKRVDHAIDEWDGGPGFSFELTDGEAQATGLSADGSLSVDLDRVLSGLDGGLKDAVHEILQNMLETSTRSFVEAFRKKKRRFNGQLARPLRGFYRRLKKRWGHVFDLFDGIRIMAMQVAHEFQLDEAWDDDNGQMVGVLLRLHARACQVASEIAALCRSGHPDGAHARWRTLHEITVVSQVLRQGGPELVRRYLNHEVVESAKAAVEYQATHASLGVDPLPENEIQEYKRTRATLIKNYSKGFDSPYGWAADHLGKQRPTFAQLEQSVDFGHIRSKYRLASHNVHANPKGIRFRMGLAPNKDIALAGPSNTGFADPLSDAAYSLGNITSTLVTLGPSLDTLVGTMAMLEVKEELGEEALTVQKQIEDEEIHLEQVQ